MHVATMLYTTDYAMAPDAFAVACEERGIESVWFPEHTHIPASRRTPFPPGGDLPRDYWHIQDPFVALGMAAGVTRRLKLATGVSLVTEHHPISLAKQVATLDRLSDGRFLFGIGAGWNAEEMENHGTPFAERWKVLDERLAAMKRIWSDEEAEFHGRYVDFDPIWAHPKPVQRPHPPVWIGAATPFGRERVARHADGWLPIEFQVKDLAADLRDLRERAKKAGRDPDAIGVTVFWASEDPERLKRYRELGVERVILPVPAVPEGEALAMLDRYAALAKSL